MRINFFRQPDVTLALTTLTSQKRDSDDNVKGNVPLTQQVRLRTNMKSSTHPNGKILTSRLTLKVNGENICVCNNYRLLHLYVNICTSSVAVILRDFRSAISSAKERVHIFTFKCNNLFITCAFPWICKTALDESFSKIYNFQPA